MPEEPLPVIGVYPFAGYLAQQVTYIIPFSILNFEINIFILMIQNVRADAL